MCGKQITTTDGATIVTMQSGRTASLHRCNLKRGHKSPCGYIEIDHESTTKSTRDHIQV